MKRDDEVMREALRILDHEGRTTLSHREFCKAYGFGLGGGSRAHYDCTCGRDARLLVVETAVLVAYKARLAEKAL